MEKHKRRNTYFSRNVAVSGNINASGNATIGGTLTSTGKILSKGAIEATGGAVSASTSIYANNGYLYSVCNGKTTYIGAQNTSHTHYCTDATDSHWFNKTVRVAGALYKGSSYNQNVPAVFVQTSQPTATQIGDIWVI